MQQELPLEPPKPKKPAQKRLRAPRRPKTPPPPGGWEKLRPVAMWSLVVMLLDQMTKYIVLHQVQLERVREIDLIDPWLNLRMAWNQGMNFGLMSSSESFARWALIAIAVGVCLWITVWVGRTVRPTRFVQLSAGLLIGGALGNVIDRLLYGAVADFLNMSLPGWRNPYSFNVADIAIFIGAIGLVFQPPGDGDKARDGARKPR